MHFSVFFRISDVMIYMRRKWYACCFLSSLALSLNVSVMNALLMRSGRSVATICLCSLFSVFQKLLRLESSPAEKDKIRRKGNEEINTNGRNVCKITHIRRTALSDTRFSWFKPQWNRLLLLPYYWTSPEEGEQRCVELPYIECWEVTSYM